MRSDNPETIATTPVSTGLDANVSWFKYIPKHEIDEWEACGWVITDGLEGLSHGEWAVLGKWPHKSEPICPKSTMMRSAATRPVTVDATD